jgi:hypothetical protein
MPAAGDISQPSFALGPAPALNRAALAEKYGEENADFLLEQLAGLTGRYQRLAYIDTPVPDAGKWEAAARDIAATRGWRFERLPGDLGWLRRMIDGDWSDEEFLQLRPGECAALFSDERLIGSEPT